MSQQSEVLLGKHSSCNSQVPGTTPTGLCPAQGIAADQHNTAPVKLVLFPQHASMSHTTSGTHAFSIFVIRNFVSSCRWPVFRR